jgi:hypothetical protein
MTGVIYFAEQIGGSLVKIGWTKGCPKRRVQSLQTGSPVELRLLGTIPAESIEDEKRLHTQFAELRVKGEWFKRSKEILALLPKPSRAPPVDKNEARLSAYVLDRFRLLILSGFSSVDEVAEMSGVRPADLRAGSIQGFFDAQVDWRKVNMALDKKRARYPMRRENDGATKSMLRRRMAAQ